MSNYIPLHLHSHFSLLDGLSKPVQIAERCESLGFKSCALTDHGTISGCVQFYKAMKTKNIKPILGCELYISSEDSHIKTKDNSQLTHFIVLAKNKKGWDNLIKIVSESNKPENFYHKPRLDFKKLANFLDGNLIGFCGHLGSTLADIILNQPGSARENGINFISQMKEIFGEDNFFLEAQLMDKDNIPEQIQLTDFIRQLGKTTKTKVICTPDAHYCDKSDSVDQRILLCNNLKTTFIDINKKLLNHEDVPMGCFFKSDNYHILTPEEMKELHTEEEIENTNHIDSLIESYDILSNPCLPKFECPNNMNPDEYLRELCRRGWKEKIANVIPKEQHEVYVDRIKKELDVLQGANLSSYFLIVQDIVDYVRRNGWLPGPGRGCFLPDTRVKMANNKYIPICFIKAGDSVIDAFGNSQKVLNVLEYDVDEDILELEIDNKIIRCTKDHKFLTSNRGWVEAQNLTENDDIVKI